jgi:hypothetical protein
MLFLSENMGSQEKITIYNIQRTITKLSFVFSLSKTQYASEKTVLDQNACTNPEYRK